MRTQLVTSVLLCVRLGFPGSPSFVPSSGTSTTTRPRCTASFFPAATIDAFHFRTRVSCCLPICSFVFFLAFLCTSCHIWTPFNLFGLADSNDINKCEFKKGKGAYDIFFQYLFQETFCSLASLDKMIQTAQVCALLDLFVPIVSILCYYVHLFAMFCCF